MSVGVLFVFVYVICLNVFVCNVCEFLCDAVWSSDCAVLCLCAV